MNVLVTGGAGYIGSTLVPLLLDRGHRVTVFDTLSSGVDHLLPFFRDNRFHLIKGDILDKPALSAAVRGRGDNAPADAIVHLAAVSGHPACTADPVLAEEVNITGTENLVTAAGEGVILLFASTGSCYGAFSGGLCSEETALNPLSLYAKTKARGEEIVRDRSTGPSVIFRFATVFGISPKMRLDLLINNFVYELVQKKSLTVYEKDARRTFIHIQDAARAIDFALNNPAALSGETYNVGDMDQNFTKKEVCESILDRMNNYGITDVLANYAGVGSDPDKRDYAVSYNKINSLGFRTEISFSDGVEELLRAMIAIS
jgi:nucleoside-diphosphate-sugar epimerase